MLLVLPRTYDPVNGTFGNLYSSLLEYVISAALIFYVLTVSAVFRLRHTRPKAPRPYRTWGYPMVPAAYILTAGTILVVLFAYRPATTWPGLLIALLGIPVYFLIRPRNIEGLREFNTDETANSGQPTASRAVVGNSPGMH